MSGSEEQAHLGRARQADSWSLWVRVMLLALAVLSAYPVLALLIGALREVPVWSAAALAAAICFLGGSLAMLFTAWLRGPQGALYGLVLGIMFRMGLPLLSGMVLSQFFPELGAPGFFALVLGYYLVTLVAETLLVLPLLQDNQTTAKGA